MLQHALQQGQREGGGLAGAGLGGAHDVTALQHHGDGLGLDWRHGLVTHLGDRAGQRGGQLQLGKGHEGGVTGEFVRSHGSGGQFSIQIGLA